MNADQPLILAAGELQPGDYVHEFGDVVTSVAESTAWFGIRDVTFREQPGVFQLFFADHYHVGREKAEEKPPEKAEDKATDKAVRGVDWEW